MAIAEVKKNGVFVLPGIGRLVRVDRKARMGRNPATGESHQDPGQEGREVPRGEGREGRDRSAEEGEVVSFQVLKKQKPRDAQRPRGVFRLRYL